MKEEISICWIRRDLRLVDHAALYHALNGDYPVVLVYIFELDRPYRLPDAFIYHTLKELNAVLNKISSFVYVMQDQPLLAFEKICQEFDVKAVYANHDDEPFGIKRDQQVSHFLVKQQIDFHSYKDQVVFERAEVMKLDGKPYTIFTPYANAWKKKYAESDLNNFPSEKLLDKLLKSTSFHFPTAFALGVENEKSRVAPFQINEELIKAYHLQRDLPTVNGTSLVGVHLRYGTVSIRVLVKLAYQLNEKWLNELIWREFFMMILFHYPEVENHNFKKKYDRIQWRNNETEFELWCKGETGYPLVDAGMRQLNETGWMHNRVRMIVAGFLTKHLLIDWRWGAAYFAEKLIDYDLAANNGNWQWAAGTGCDSAPYFRIFNPLSQAKKFDPQLLYVKKWIKNFPQDYCLPIVDHDFARKRALAVYKSALKG